MAEMEQLLVLVGVVTFAITGALVAIEKRFDVVGVLILAGVTAVGGGSVRDLVAGTIPPTALTDETLIWLPLVTGLVVFLVHRHLPTGRTLYAFNTTTPPLSAALGAEPGLQVGFGFWGTVFAGTISGVGGGLIRDVLSGEVPGILYRSGDFYATAAAAGAAVTFLLHPFEPVVGLVAGAVVAVAVRVGSRLLGIELPVPRTSGELDG
jgi:uncharacterized membrane protein YeiH